MSSYTIVEKTVDTSKLHGMTLVTPAAEESLLTLIELVKTTR